MINGESLLTGAGRGKNPFIFYLVNPISLFKRLSRFIYSINTDQSVTGFILKAVGCSSLHQGALESMALPRRLLCWLLASQLLYNNIHEKALRVWENVFVDYGPEKQVRFSD